MIANGVGSCRFGDADLDIRACQKIHFRMTNLEYPAVVNDNAKRLEWPLPQQLSKLFTFHDDSPMMSRKPWFSARGRQRLEVLGPSAAGRDGRYSSAHRVVGAPLPKFDSCDFAPEGRSIAFVARLRAESRTKPKVDRQEEVLSKALLQLGRSIRRELR